MDRIRTLVVSLSFAASLAAPRAHAAAPANPNATPEARALLQLLTSLSGQKILSGQESMWNDGSFPSTRDQYVKQKTGKYPAVYVSDFGDFGTGNLQDRRRVVSNAIAYHRQGSIISFQYHLIQPDLPDGSGFQAMNIKGSTYTKVPDMLTPGHALNTELNRRLDDLAGYFRTLQDSGVPVIWRPYHEMTGDFFWWSHQDRFQDLWKYTFDYLTTKKQCNNLLWMFSANWYPAGSTGKNAPEFYYPGHAYVDMLGCDFYVNYGHAYDKRIHDALVKLGGGRPLAITECGTMPDIAKLRAEQPYWVYWATWWGFEGADKGNTDALYAANYGHADVLTQDELAQVAIDTTLRLVRVTVEGSGSVTRNPSGSSVPKGTAVTFTAVPANGWEFQGWSGASTATLATLTLTVNAHVELTALFKAKPGTLVNLIKNGDFGGGTAEWNPLAGYEGAAATAAVQDGRLAVDISNGGTQAWHVQLTQGGIALEKGKTYTLSFEAQARAAKPLYVKVGQAGGTYKEYAGLSVTLGTTSQTYRKTFTMADSSDPGARVEFNVGGDIVGLTLDNVVLMEGNGVGVRRVLASQAHPGPRLLRTREGLAVQLPAGRPAIFNLSGRQVP